ncbi:MAG TPA: dienelactone hydrolase family protein [Burkholderiales bacterium]|nr:dienelactone hydrolase family protein [Burkholderiales bacterium]
MNELQRYLVEEAVEDYEEGRLTRRQALAAIAGVAGAALAARVLDASAQAGKTAKSPPPKGPPSTPPQVAPNDPDIVAGVAEFPGEGARLDGYLARPARPGLYPVVLVCHENRGLTRHIEDVARRLAKAGYVALAVDLLSREGGTDKHDFDAIPGILGKAPPARHVQDFKSGLAYARSQNAARIDRAGMVGFCFGGGVTWRVAAALPELRAAVPFYGVPAPEADVPGIGAAVLAIYAGRDDRINQSIPGIEAAMARNGKTFRKIVYPDVDHAFHNDSGTRYNAEAAKAAWSETLAWFGKYLA